MATARNPRRDREEIMSSSREQMAALTAAGGMADMVVPKMPYMPPPSNPRDLPQWYDRWYAAMEKWREELATSISQRSV
jgi:hypothetical protein